MGENYSNYGSKERPDTAVITRKDGSKEYYKGGKLKKERKSTGKNSKGEEQYIDVVRINLEKDYKTGRTNSTDNVNVSSKQQAIYREAEKVQKVINENAAAEQKYKQTAQDYVQEYGVYGSKQNSLYMQTGVNSASSTHPKDTSKVFDKTPYSYNYRGDYVKGIVSYGGETRPPKQEQPKSKGFKNVKETFQTILNPFNEDSKAGRVANKIISPFVPKPKDATGKIVSNTKNKGFNKGAEAVANNPFETAFYITGGAGSLAYKKASTGLKAATTFVKYKIAGDVIQKTTEGLGQATGTKRFKENIKNPNFRDVLSKSYEAERQATKGVINSFKYEISPIFSSKQNKQVFVNAAYNEYKKLGYSDDKASQLAIDTYRYRRYSALGEAYSQLSIGAGSERVGRILTAKSSAVFTQVSKAGFLEGYFFSQKQQRTRQGKVDEGQAIATGFLGGATAGTISKFASLPKGYGTISKGTSYAANILDPLEYPSDKLATLTTKAASKRVYVPVMTFTNTQTKTQTKIQTDSKTLTDSEFKKGIGSNVQNFGDTAINPKSFVFVKTNTNEYKVNVPTLTEFKAPTNVKEKVPNEGRPKPINKPQPYTNTLVKQPVPVITKTKPITNTQTKTQTKTQTNTFTNTKTLVYTPKFSPFTPSPRFPSGGVYSYKYRQKNNFNQNKVYTPSGFAAALNIRGKKGSSLGGFGLRPIIENKKKNKRLKI